MAHIVVLEDVHPRADTSLFIRTGRISVPGRAFHATWQSFVSGRMCVDRDHPAAFL